MPNCTTMERSNPRPARICATCSGLAASPAMITAGSPGDHAGLKVYDLILSVDDRDVVSDDELIREISLHQPGSTVALRVLRDDRERSVAVKLAERPAAEERAATQAPDPGVRPADDPEAASGGAPTIGLSVRDLDDAFARRFGIPASVTGVVVSRVDTAGPAYAEDLRRGFVIMEVNRRPVRDAADFERIVAASRPGDVLALLVYSPATPGRDLIAVTVDEVR